MLKDIVIVNKRSMSVYSFVGYMVKNETPEEALQRAIKSNQEDIDSWKSNIEKYGSSEKFENYLREHQENTFEIMTYEDFNKKEKEYYTSMPFHEITEEDFDYALNVLPPLKWKSNQRLSMFLMCEFWTGTFTTQYLHDKVNHKYYSKMVDASDSKTWLDQLIIYKTA